MNLIKSVEVFQKSSDGWYCQECSYFGGGNSLEKPVICSNKKREVLNVPLALERAQEYFENVKTLDEFDDECLDVADNALSSYAIDYVYSAVDIVECKSTEFWWRNPEPIGIDKHDSTLLNFWKAFSEPRLPISLRGW
jgi:hypothetical protein